MSRIRRAGTATLPVPETVHKPAQAKRRLAPVMWVPTTALVLLALLVLGGAVWSRTRGFAGPSSLDIAAHAVGAVAALLLQRVLRHGSAVTRPLAAVAILAILAGLLWFFWWQ